MTQQEAQQEAKRIYGSNAHVAYVESPKWKYGSRFSIYSDKFACVGSSIESWEDAFTTFPNETECLHDLVDRIESLIVQVDAVIAATANK
jgi:hypothetical protein